MINAGFPDHHSPPLSVMWSIYSIIDFWLARDDQNVVAIHCLAGKGRTGLTIICTLLMQGFFNSVPGKTKDIINAAINYFLDKRGDGVENPDQVRFIYQFVQSMNTMGTDAYKITSQHLQPLNFISDLILYNLPVGVGEPLHPRLQVFLKARNTWDVVYTSEWNQQRSQSISSFHSSFVIPVCSLDGVSCRFVSPFQEIFFSSFTTAIKPCFIFQYPPFYYPEDPYIIQIHFI